MAETNLDNLDALDSLLDKSLDDIADLPEFKAFNPGLHKAKLSWEIKEIEKQPKGETVKRKIPHIQLGLEYIELLEHSDAKWNGSPSKAGDKCSTTYDLTNEFAMGALKKAIKSLGNSIGTQNMKEIIKQTNGFEVAVLVKHRKNATNPDNPYLQVEDLLPL